jgi:UDP-N-acetylmuramoyl-tripeptide--D-alanyl-D-alanine ligase
VDGHDFVAPALSAGAGGAVVSREAWEVRGARWAGAFPEKAFIAAPEPLRALQDFAGSYRRSRLGSVRRVGVSGSSGKSSFKSILGKILGRSASVTVNPGNLNSEIGLPAALLSIKPGDAFGILEMGINRPGEMELLAGIFAPQVGVITGIGAAHIGFFGSREGIAREKKNIFRYLGEPREPAAGPGGDNAGFVPGGDPFFNFLKEGVPAPVYPLAPEQTPGFLRAENLGLEGFNLHFKAGSVRLGLLGRHNAATALGAAQVALYLGASGEDVLEGLKGISPLPGRGEVVRGPVTLILDYYNASPESFFGGLEFCKELPWAGRKILVAGAMGELGGQAAPLHRELGRRIGESGFAGGFLFGRDMEEAYAEVGDSGRFYHSDNFSDLARGVKSLIRTGDLVYLKGSRGTELERLKPVLEGCNV